MTRRLRLPPLGEPALADDAAAETELVALAAVEVRLGQLVDALREATRLAQTSEADPLGLATAALAVARVWTDLDRPELPQLSAADLGDALLAALVQGPRPVH